MSEKTFTLSTFDVQRLEPLLARDMRAHELPGHLESLLGKIYGCEEIPPVAVPPYLVTMNSQVRLLDLASGKESVCTLVFPLQADSSAGKISVLAPLGASLFGARVGATIDVPVPAGSRRYLIKELVFQPESVGQYDL